MRCSPNNIKCIQSMIDKAEAIVIGAGAGLSTSAGFTYSGERFEKYFGDFASRYGFNDMYSGGFYPFETPEVWDILYINIITSHMRADGLRDVQSARLCYLTITSLYSRCPSFMTSA